MSKHNYKLDIKQMTEEFNAIDKEITAEINGTDLINLTHEQMSDMVQRHAFKLGVTWTGTNQEKIFNINYRFILIDNEIDYLNKGESGFDSHTYKQIGLEFFKIKPEEKMLTVRMSEESYKAMTGVPITESWELVE